MLSPILGCFSTDNDAGIHLLITTDLGHNKSYSLFPDLAFPNLTLFWICFNTSFFDSALQNGGYIAYPILFINTILLKMSF